MRTVITERANMVDGWRVGATIINYTGRSYYTVEFSQARSPVYMDCGARWYKHYDEALVAATRWVDELTISTRAPIFTAKPNH